ncbi:hypothetical protein CLV59_107181 [Chitinophaga dinghuensis]|uniref:6-pyruvoyl-tetrahydropterin synthase-like protein n=1 Tax=Chitinophaga dinghuensis TaxID=1539050 RepID=A0A327VSM0_9BACT|nr:FxLYD domain-containing protein [Chitinophaga dinghuensis]RAJ77414.1 hypothetical protein CLV59_107181 [Chitinophaga dinghuensis]
MNPSSNKADRLLLIALLLALLLHGAALIYNADKTYDAFVHMFFADHYSRSWFDPWEPRWYTGFPVTSYPPLGHQLIALCSKIGGLKFGFFMVAMTGLCFFVIGIYRFSLLWVSKRSAGYAAIYAVLASSIIETIHIFGQLPTVIGISCLLNALPEIYAYFRNSRFTHLLLALALLGVTVASHHVTTIFGIIFFIAPIIATALADEINLEESFGIVAWKMVKKAFQKWKSFVLFFGPLFLEIIIIIFPYWYWSKTDPISQVPIPHGSRDSFIHEPSSGLMFFIIPLGFTILLLPFILRSLFNRRNVFLALSFCLLLLLGTGGTTPLPAMILGKNAFNILTLDRFTFWASIIAIPFIGDFFCRIVEGDIRERIIHRYGKKMYHFTSLLMIATVLFQGLALLNFHKFRKLQPDTIELRPLLNFLSRDQHDKWRFMTLGFGDQMAWLSSQTTASSIDGNYHSARRVPEMTGKPLERLENSKFKGIPGLGSLHQFLTIPEKYYLKFIFSNDKFYDPILFFTGWERVQRLENGIMVWQKADVPPLPAVTGRKNIPRIQCLMWGILPLSSLFILFIVLLICNKRFLLSPFPNRSRSSFKPANGNRLLFSWMGIILLITVAFQVKATFRSLHNSPEMLIRTYYHALDFKDYTVAYSCFPPGAERIDNYLLQLSVRDGLLASYGKLDSLSFKITSNNHHQAFAKVVSHWTTPLEEYEITDSLHLVELNHKWYLLPPSFQHPPAPDEHIEKGVLALHSQGSRIIDPALTRQADIQDRPSIAVVSARLVKLDSQYIVVGEISNTSAIPAHLTITAELYDRSGSRLISYNTRYNTIHDLLPGEVVPFRIDFEQTAWLRENDLRPFKFEPYAHYPFTFNTAPATFKILAKAVVGDKDLYRDDGIMNIRIDSSINTLQAAVYNYGVEEITIPQILLTYYDQQQKVLFVDHHFLKDGIRQQAKETFSCYLADTDSIQVIYNGDLIDFYVNGLQQQHPFESNNSRLPVGSRRSVRLSLNTYIGNPTIY